MVLRNLRNALRTTLERPSTKLSKMFKSLSRGGQTCLWRTPNRGWGSCCPARAWCWRWQSVWWSSRSGPSRSAPCWCPRPRCPCLPPSWQSELGVFCSEQKHHRNCFSTLGSWVSGHVMMDYKIKLLAFMFVGKKNAIYVWYVPWADGYWGTEVHQGMTYVRGRDDAGRSAPNIIN